MQLTQFLVARRGDGHLALPPPPDVVGVQLKVLDVGQPATVGAHGGCVDGIVAFEQPLRRILPVQPVEVVFIIVAVGEEVYPALPVHDGEHILALPVGILLVAVAGGVVALHLRIVGPPVAFAVHEHAALPTLVEEDAAVGVLVGVVLIVEVVVAEESLWRSPFHLYRIGRHAVVPPRGEVDPSAVPAPALDPVVGLVVGQLPQLAARQRHQHNVEVAVLPRREGQPLAVRTHARVGLLPLQGRQSLGRPTLGLHPPEVTAVAEDDLGAVGGQRRLVDEVELLCAQGKGEKEK